jgi:hypothetical protein
MRFEAEAGFIAVSRKRHDPSASLRRLEVLQTFRGSHRSNLLCSAFNRNYSAARFISHGRGIYPQPTSAVGRGQAIELLCPAKIAKHAARFLKCNTKFKLSMFVSGFGATGQLL